MHVLRCMVDGYVLRGYILMNGGILTIIDIVIININVLERIRLCVCVCV